MYLSLSSIKMQEGYNKQSKKSKYIHKGPRDTEKCQMQVLFIDFNHWLINFWVEDILRMTYLRNVLIDKKI